MPVFQLSEGDIWFPDPRMARKDGLLAVGGDLSPDRLLLAYTNGIFPWYEAGSEILWWCPNPRFVIFPAEIHISKSMKKTLKKQADDQQFSVRFNHDFQAVMHQCRKLREEEEGTWITDEMEAAYCRLYELGYAVSVEVYERECLTGGLYGVSIGRCFFGESMFSKTRNASKTALIHLAYELIERNFEFIDCQFHTEHLESMGGRYLSYAEYMERMQKGLKQNMTGFGKVQ